jgi:hypothetical protein
MQYLPLVYSPVRFQGHSYNDISSLYMNLLRENIYWMFSIRYWTFSFYRKLEVRQNKAKGITRLQEHINYILNLKRIIIDVKYYILITRPWYYEYNRPLRRIKTSHIFESTFLCVFYVFLLYDSLWEMNIYLSFLHLNI